MFVGKTLKVKKNFDDARVPERANPTDSGADVYVYGFKKLFSSSIVYKSNVEAENPESVTLLTNDRVLIDTGLSVTVGSGFEIQVRPRSGNALNRGLIVVNSPGTIDESYRGMLGIIIANIGHEPQVIRKGEKIAQIVIAEVKTFPIEVVKELDQTDRGEGGFGSTDN